jgi:membrane complex biogenesis BtpA family protein
MSRPLLGVVHLPPLPSSRGHRSMADVRERALADARAYADGGFDGVVVENFGDAPFHKGTRDDPAPPDAIAGLAVAAALIVADIGLPVGINCLRNDGMAALGVAAAVGARWVRVNVLAGAYVTDQGLVEGEAARLAAYRRQLGWQGLVLADHLVKHAAPLAPLDVAAGAKDLAERSGADGIVLSGRRTGEPVDGALLAAVRAAVGGFPLWLGSGLSLANAAALWPACDGAIVGTACKREGRVDQPVDPARVRALRAACPVGAG